jgi:hypothetical protein
MKCLLVAVLCVAIPSMVMAGDNGYKVTRDDGLPDAKAGTGMKMYIRYRTRWVSSRAKDQILAIPATSITEITYGQDVHRRIGTAVGLAVVSLRYWCTNGAK